MQAGKRSSSIRFMRTTLALAACSLMASCGGGGSSSTPDWNQPSNPNNPQNPGNWTPGAFLPSSTFKDLCANPRSGTDYFGDAFPDRLGTRTDENNWLRSWTNDLYLWYSEVTDRNPALYTNPLTYFDLMKTNATTASGAPKDKFHFTWATDEWQAFSDAGVTAGYGATFIILEGQPPRDVRVVLVEPGSPAANEGLQRGDEVLMIDGVDVQYGNNVAVLNAGLFPEDINESHQFQVRNSGGTRDVTMISAEITSTPVHTVDVIPTASGPVGYLLFNDHIATAEAGLVDAITTFDDENIVDLVLDVRYNGGGYLAIASQLAYMIAGNARTSGQVFERTVWNDKHTATNPVTGAALQPMPFYNQTLGFSRPTGTPLPALNLSRVFVLTTGDTCSASEAIINSLRGVDVEVIQIGSTTCGKPYGFYAFDNCGTTYFSVQFKGVNAKNYGDYTDGFSPSNTQNNAGERVTGCSVDDDLGHDLGDPTERMLSVALAYRGSNQCSLPAAGFGMQKRSGARSTGIIARPPYREIRVMRD